MKNYRISVVGLGYVGLPLAVEFSKYYPTIGYDINKRRIKELSKYNDTTLEVSKKILQKVVVGKLNSKIFKKGLYLTDKLILNKDSNIYIVTVPTPTDKNKKPFLKPLIEASKSVGKVLSKGNIVIYESTVYPGVTEEICAPILEKESKLVYNKDFFLGYSPERINPGDKERTITKILKVTSGSNKKIAIEIDNLYKKIITAGTHLAPSIKVAEAAKVIENSQRDINIAFVNELAKIFNLLEIDTNAVLEAAGTKWNFLNFKPGLVGGHCIGVDPHYLAQKAIDVGYKPEIILAGRRLNDSMGFYVADKVIELMKMNDIKIKNSSILILGITFKENCPDVRNTKVVDIVFRLNELGVRTTIYDPWANPIEVKQEFGLISYNNLIEDKYDSIILAVSHNQFYNLDYQKLKSNKAIIYDVKGFLGDISDAKL